MDSPNPILEARGLSVQYFGGVGGVHDLDLAVQRGECVAMIGTNGSGKTSALRALAGFLPRESATITAGKVIFEGKDITGRTPQHIAHLGIAMVPERDKVFVELTPMEHFRLTRLKSRGEFSSNLDRVLGIFPDLGSHLSRRAGYLSGGQRQMLAFASALFRSPRVMLIDEFSQGLAPTVVDSLAQIVRKLQDDGTTLVLVEQNVAIARSIADRLYILDAGRVLVSGTHDELSLSEVTRRYLGLADDDR